MFFLLVSTENAGKQRREKQVNSEKTLNEDRRRRRKKDGSKEIPDIMAVDKLPRRKRFGSFVFDGATKNIRGVV